MMTHKYYSTRSPSRRGSAILIVVGTLALIAVFAAIYISIGQSDQRVADSISNRNELNANADTVANHVLEVLRDDRLDFFTQHIDGGTAVFVIPELTDAQYTDWTMLSESDNLWERFNPSGRHWLPGNIALTDHRVASDPWLASTTPTYLGDPGQPSSGNDLRPFGSLITTVYSDPATLQQFIGGAYSSGFLDNRDWLQISNLAPDGRFVNLFNLRPNVLESNRNNGFDDTRLGGFDSEPGIGVVDLPDGRQIRRMSEYLSLWNQEQPGIASSRIKAFDPVESGAVWLPGRNEPVSVTGLDIPNTPAVWTMYQRFAFLPINQPFLTVNRHDQISTWADPDYINYQWADADGDGMTDSRWFELTSAQDTQSASSNPRTDVERLYDSGKSRIFAAVRIMDLSSIVNINTATDQLAIPEPDEGAPLGATPGEVDLRRLLTMQDAAENYAISSPFAKSSVSPSQYHRPRGARLNRAGSFPEQIRDDDYFYYRSMINTDDPTDIQVYPHSTSLSIGRYAYDSIKRGMVNINTLDDRYYAWPPESQARIGDPIAAPNTGDFDEVFNPPNTDFNANDLNYRLTQEFKGTELAQDRKELYEEYGALNPNNTSIAGLDIEPNALYDNDDLIELLTFWGLNDPSANTRLEKAAMGRMPSIYEQNQRAFTPLLSNRPLDLDRKQHGYIDERGYVNSYMIADPRDKREISGGIAKESMAFFATSPRRLMTTISGATHLKSGAIANPNSPSLVGQNAPTLQSVLSSPSQLFNLYTNALAGELSFNKLASPIDNHFALDPTDARDKETATLFYGHRGPELALRIAAHTAVNMKDLYDDNQTPTAVTLIMDLSVADDFLEDYDPETRNSTEYTHYAGRATGNVFNPGNTIPNNGFTGDQEHRKVVDIFGIEPMPFLTEMSSLYVYADSSNEQGAADGSGGDDASPIAPRRRNGIVQFPNPLVEVTINGDVTEINTDLKIQLIAFQLTNPWNEDIQIGGDSGPMGYLGENINSPSDINLEFNYYIEFGGRFFKLGEFVDYNPLDNRYGDVNDPASPPINGPITSDHDEYQYQSVTIPANSSRVFYAIADGRYDTEDSSTGLDADWQNELGNPTAYTDIATNDLDGDGLADGLDGQGWTGPAQEWVNRQLGTRGGLPPVHIHQFDPTTGLLVEEDGFHNLMVSPDDPLYEDNTTSGRTHDHSEARLWLKIKGSLEESIELSPPPGAERDNLIQNDMLVDRLKVPTGETFNRPLPDGNQAIQGSFGYNTAVFPMADENTIGARNDNFGLSIARWATVRRLDNPDNESSQKYRSGQIGAWMLSSRSAPDEFTIFSHDPIDAGNDGDLDIADFLDDSLAALSAPTFLSSAKIDYEVDRTFRGFWEEVFVNSRKVLVQTIVRKPANKWKIIDSNEPTPFGINFDIRYPTKYLPANSVGDILHALDSDLVPELLPNANRFNGTPRLADLLLAWGIGPTHTPDPDRRPIDISFDDTNIQGQDEGLRWMTLPEAIALGIGYETVDAHIASESQAESVWYQAMSANGEVFDNGHLALDNYVAYYNVDTSELSPDFDTLTDIRRGTGVPMALGVLDQARPLAPKNTSADPLTTPTYGLININTAPVEVLRLLPGLTPSRTNYYADNTAPGTDEWWANDFPDLDLPNLSKPFDPASPELRTPDVASLIVAYRDRLKAMPRLSSYIPNAPGINILIESNPIRYSSLPITEETQLGNMLQEQTASELSQTDDHRDRATIAGVNGLRPTPGFGSVGEILMATIDSGALGEGGASLPSFYSQLDIQQYGSDTLNLDGISDTEIAIDPQLFGGTKNGSTVDDYAERLAMANGILNTISVRSDYYAVWFVIHAYQESDVTNLLPEDPLIPSIAKRYLMVVDRTNVVDPGDTPKILFLREVPM
ncbi:MAG: hypothetical protein JKY43_08510 [Phycisphaerales bacterium]|nr:hypothetical protein [Phycisphaerales bacterium]